MINYEGISCLDTLSGEFLCDVTLTLPGYVTLNTVLIVNNQCCRHSCFPWLHPSSLTFFPAEFLFAC